MILKITGLNVRAYGVVRMHGYEYVLWKVVSADMYSND